MKLLAPTIEAAKTAGAVTMNSGLFINAIVKFIIVAFAVFLMIRSINRLKKPEVAPAAAPTTKDCPYCYSAVAIKATRCAFCTAELKS